MDGDDASLTVTNTTLSDNALANDNYQRFGIYFDSVNGTPVFDNLTVQNNLGHGIYASSATFVSLDNCIITNNQLDGVNLANTNVQATNCTLAENGNAGLFTQNSNVNIVNSILYDNTNFGIFNNSSSPVVIATNNWWGHPTGPYHATLIPMDRGMQSATSLNSIPGRLILVLENRLK